MAIHYPDILDETAEPRTFSYRDTEVMLYALGIGLGADPMNEAELPFVYERNLKVVPTALTVLSAGAGARKLLPMKPGQRLSEINYAMILHGEQKVELFKPLPAAGTFTAESRMVGVWDKGAAKGAVICEESVWRDAAGEAVATSTHSIFARGDGGFGGPSQGAPEPHPTPQRAPDVSVDLPTRPDQALLYRLNGDRNPLHSDPQAARLAGFDRPILHGLCTYGMTCRAVLQAMTDFDPDVIRSHQARFSAPVFPGDVVTVDLWRDGKDVAFVARVKARDVVVVKNGLTRLR
jgi:acyl dehydratase